MAMLNIKVGPTLSVLMDLNENDGVARNIQYCLKQLGFKPADLVTNTRYANTGFQFQFKDDDSGLLLNPAKSLLEQGFAQRNTIRAGVGFGNPSESSGDPWSVSTAVRTLEIVDADGNSLTVEPPYPGNRHGQATIPKTDFP